MSNIFQRTINKKINCNGIGLHSGKEVNINILPAEANSGIVFRRTDIKEKNNEILAHFENVTTTNLGTTISNADGASVSTIEHLMAAIWGCEIDNLIIEIDEVEVPVMDGSSAPFIFMFECAGRKDLDEHRKFIEILKKVEFIDGDKSLSVEPADEFFAELEIDFHQKTI